MTWASRPPSIPSGSASPEYARVVMSKIDTYFSGSPFTYQRAGGDVFSHARSSGRVSSIVAAISRALSRTLRETTATAAPDTGVERLPCGAGPRRALGAGPEHRGGDQPPLVAPLARADRHGRAGHRRRAAAVRAEPVRGLV